MKKSILMVGQSNMAGRGFLHDVTEIVDERIFMFRNTRWQMMNEPINFDRHVAGVGPAASFASTWLLDHPEDNLALIPCAEGGSNISEWAEDQPFFKNAIAQTKVAVETSELVAILWHQGESDGHSDLYLDYDDKLTTVLNAFRTHLNLPNVPIIIGTLPEALGKIGFGLSCPQFTQINQIIRSVAKTMNHVGLALADDLTLNPDGIHIDAMSQRIFGVRYYNAYKKILNPCNVSDEEKVVLENINARKHTMTEKLHRLNGRFALGTCSFDDYMKSYQAITQEEQS